VINSVNENTGALELCNWFLREADQRSASVIGSLNSPATTLADGSLKFTVGLDPTAPPSVRGALIQGASVVFFPAPAQSMANAGQGKLVCTSVSSGFVRELLIEVTL
jgi:hypothetical protein